MKTIRQRIVGKLFVSERQAAVLIEELKPAKEIPAIYLRYGLLLQGVETIVFPEILLDDWGKEIKGLALYRWIHEFGDQFPRAEIFGYTLAGKETQHFLREFELYAKLPSYVYPHPETPLPDGTPIEAILWPDKTIATPQRIKQPTEVTRPLRAIQATWWAVPPHLETFTF